MIPRASSKIILIYALKKTLVGLLAFLSSSLYAICLLTVLSSFNFFSISSCDIMTVLFFKFSTAVGGVFLGSKEFFRFIEST